MKVVAILSLAAVVAGANIRNHFEDGCRGGYINYPNIAQRTCALGLHDNNTKGSVSIAFSALPQHSAVYGWQGNRSGNLCGTIAKKDNVGNTDHKCLGSLSGGSQYAGSSWTQPGFNLRGAKQDTTCTAKVAPHSLVLNDGHKYILGGMEEDMMKSLYDLAVKGTTSQELPSEYAVFEIEKESVEQRAQDIQA
ncbi:uncharacterized protein GIQ15_05594 [Arthroderma uncinatum]|uniref:uncharacterized protein n=1 Tax=Arthroderma uncinatum TaxID=74035 RepID=UPI00144A5EBF|nr:uncharacterized protein GIQ15_05594 [Arthroderma uncinatum]KAF3480247.1 hypothetical protein GIQ15_05594 [Arthroderma uncinatum]